MPLFTSMLIALLISVIFMMVATILSKKSFIDREKSSPFESGFDPKNTSRLPFSLRFFLIAIIFLIFDVEISLLLPVGLIFKLQPPLFLFITFTLFLLIVTLGLFYEWKEGTLDWLE